MRNFLRSMLDISLLSVIVFVLCFSANAEAAPSVEYKAHVAGRGWQSWISDGQIAGTTGQNRQLEAVMIRLTKDEKSMITYCAHVADEGWQTWRQSGEVAGTTGQGRRMEAIRIRLNGIYAKKYDVYYRVHVAELGWLDWVKNGQLAGTTGEGRQMEAIQIELRAK